MYLFQKIKSILLQSELEHQSEISIEAECFEILRFTLNRQSLNRVELSQIKESDLSLADKNKTIEISHKRSKGYPLQYILGKSYFYKREYSVSEGTLIPRPETEILVDVVIEQLHAQYSSQQELTGCEVGIGSGVITIELLCEFERLKMYASEVSGKSTELALKNYSQYIRGDLRLDVIKPKLETEVIEPFMERGIRANFLVSNPPYLNKGLSEIQNQVYRYEPHAALFAPVEDALYFYKELAWRGKAILVKDGFMALEIPHEDSREISNIFKTNHWDVKVLKDLTNRDRVVFCR